MKKFITQLFCKHIYKGTDRELLYWSRELDEGIDWISGYMPTYSNFVYSLLTEECVKCRKVRITKVRQNIGHGQPKNLEYR